MAELEEQSTSKRPPRWVLKLYTRLNVLIYRLSGGRLMQRLEGVPICLVTMQGARTGKARTIALMYVPVEEAVVLVASQGGAPKNPLWYYNLKAYPSVTIEQGGRRRALMAREVGGDERDRLWELAVAQYPAYDDYQARTDREIPVFICEG